MKHNLDKFFVGDGRKRTIEKYFNGIEYSSPEFNAAIFALWKKDEDDKHWAIILGILFPIAVALCSGALFWWLG